MNLKESIFIHFITNECKAFVRGTEVIQKTTTSIIAYVFYILLIYCFYIFGQQLNLVFIKLWPNIEYLTSFYYLLCLYSFVDLFLRHLWQKIPVIELNKYLMLNIDKKLIKLYFVFRSFFTIFSIIPFFVFIPSIYNNIYNDYDGKVLFGLINTILCISIGNHFAILYLKKCSIMNEKMFLIPLILFVSVWLLNREHIIDLSSLNIFLNNKSIMINSIILFYLGWLLLTLNVLFRELKYKFYFENVIEISSEALFKNKDFIFGEKNIVYKLVETEVKLFLRNKRPRSLLYTAIFSIIYGFIIFRNNIQEHDSLIFIGIIAIIISGIVVNNYAQYLFAWQSDYFEYILTANINVKDIIRSKFYVCDILNILRLLFKFSIFLIFV